MKTEDCESWAAETFADVDLGDVRRNRRLVAVAAGLARSPAGAVMAAMPSAAEREGAFRFLANEYFDVDDIGDGITSATLRRCSGISYVPVDAASITLTDRAETRDIGGIGSWSKRARGLHAITMLAADADGVPVGIMGAQWWARTARAPFLKSKSYRSLKTETRHVVTALTRVDNLCHEVGASTKLWFQLDRGFDAWPVFQLARDRGLLITVRSSTERRIQSMQGTGYLHKTAQRAPRLGYIKIHIPERAERPARTALLSVRATNVNLHLQVGPSRSETAPLTVVHVQEEGYRGRDRLRWILLTTATVTNLAQADAVVVGYTTRWLIEELHRAWKRGWMNIEETQLRRRNSLCKWATLHLALASRALRLSKLVRTSPKAPARTEFSDAEIDAILLLAKRVTPGSQIATPTLADVVISLAELGGYDRYSKKPAGPTVIGRGLERISALVQGLDLLGVSKK